MRIIYGVDPGFTGAIAVIVEPPGDLLVSVYAMPTLTWTGGKTKKGNPRNRTAYDESGIRRIIAAPIVAARKEGETRIEARIFLERQQAMPDQHAVSVFNLGVGYGLLRGICVGLGIPYELVTARVWQKQLLAGCGVDDTKRASIIVAQRLFPTVDLRPSEKCRVASHGMSDALLLAEHGRRMMEVQV